MLQQRLGTYFLPRKNTSHCGLLLCLFECFCDGIKRHSVRRCKPNCLASYDAQAISLVSPEPWQTTTGSPRSSGCSRTVTETKKQSMSMCMMMVSVRFICSPNTTCSCLWFVPSTSFFSWSSLRRNADSSCCHRCFHEERWCNLEALK